MPLRTAEYRRHLDNHVHRQNGEGWCWPALLEGALWSGGDTSWDREKLVKKLSATKQSGTDYQEVVTFWQEKGIPWYAEENCSTQRFEKILKLPEQVDIFASVFDWRWRPGYNLRHDPPEPHIVAPLEVTEADGVGKVVWFYDPDSLVGGRRPMALLLWPYWWHEGSDAKKGKNRRVSFEKLDDPHRRFFIVAGVGAEEVCERVGVPEEAA